MGSFFLDQLPLTVRTWIADTIPALRDLADVPEPPQQGVSDVMARMALTEEGEKVFLSTRPLLVEDIDTACGAEEDADEDFGTLGCYYSTDRIYIYSDPGTWDDDLTVVTAAHELLHAMYARLDADERDRIDALVDDEVDRLPSDHPVHDQIDASVGNHEAGRADEQYAYLGAEIFPRGGFSAELEAEYARTFTDRESLPRW